jgi:hypothetical protein
MVRWLSYTKLDPFAALGAVGMLRLAAVLGDSPLPLAVRLMRMAVDVP